MMQYLGTILRYVGRVDNCNACKISAYPPIHSIDMVSIRTTEPIPPEVEISY